MGITATFHTIMHYNSQLQLYGWWVLTKTVFQPHIHFFCGIAPIKIYTIYELQVYRLKLVVA